MAHVEVNGSRLDALGIERAALVGLSLGAARRRRDDARALVRHAGRARAAGRRAAAAARPAAHERLLDDFLCSAVPLED